MIKRIAIVVGAVLAVLIVGVLGVAATQPDTFQVARTTTIDAPPEKVFELINDFHNWGAWSPYESLDPAMRRTFSGAPSGPGSVYAWESDDRAGEGRMEIISTSPPNTVIINLDFVRPFEGHNVVEFTMIEAGDAVSTTWKMRGPTPFIAKIVHTFISMDRIVGHDFEVGLANLKSRAES